MNWQPLPGCPGYDYTATHDPATDRTRVHVRGVTYGVRLIDDEETTPEGILRATREAAQSIRVHQALAALPLVGVDWLKAIEIGLGVRRPGDDKQGVIIAFDKTTDTGRVQLSFPTNWGSDEIVNETIDEFLEHIEKGDYVLA